jgi:hypothetical protein
LSAHLTAPRPAAPPPHPHPQDIDNLPASEARRRLEAFRKRQQSVAAKAAAAVAGDADGEGGGLATPEAAAAAAARGAFEGAISEAFEGALKFYVTEEQKEVREGHRGRLLSWFRGLCRDRALPLPRSATHRPHLPHSPSIRPSPHPRPLPRSLPPPAPTAQLLRYLDQLIREEGERKWLPPDDGDGGAGAASAAGLVAGAGGSHGPASTARVLGSANALFLKIRASLTRCVKLVSRGQTLLGLAGAFRVRRAAATGTGEEGRRAAGGPRGRWLLARPLALAEASSSPPFLPAAPPPPQRVLAAYAAELLKRLPKTAYGATSAVPPYAGTDWHVRLPEEEEAVVCRILHTAEYCRWAGWGLLPRACQPAASPTSCRRGWGRPLQPPWGQGCGRWRLLCQFAARPQADLAAPDRAPGPSPPRDTIEGLSSAICKDLRPPTLAEGLDFGDEEGAFSGVAAACLSVLVLGVNTRLDAPLQVRGGHGLRSPWARAQLHQQVSPASFLAARARPIPTPLRPARPAPPDRTCCACGGTRSRRRATTRPSSGRCARWGRAGV